MRENVLKYGKDGDHFIYGYNDYGEKIGAVLYLRQKMWYTVGYEKKLRKRGAICAKQ